MPNEDDGIHASGFNVTISFNIVAGNDARGILMSGSKATISYNTIGFGADMTTIWGNQDHGIDIRGYTYWSLMDNFEWTYGYGPTFGLVACDWKTQKRTPRPSAHWLGGIAKSNTLAPRPA
jgi:beta-glucosidase